MDLSHVVFARVEVSGWKGGCVQASLLSSLSGSSIATTFNLPTMANIAFNFATSQQQQTIRH